MKKLKLPKNKLFWNLVFLSGVLTVVLTLVNIYSLQYSIKKTYFDTHYQLMKTLADVSTSTEATAQETENLIQKAFNYGFQVFIYDSTTNTELVRKTPLNESQKQALAKLAQIPEKKDSFVNPKEGDNTAINQLTERNNNYSYTSWSPKNQLYIIQSNDVLISSIAHLSITRLFINSVFATLFSIGFLYWIYNRIQKPIDQLIQKSRELGKNNVNVPLNIDFNLDELSQLESALNQLVVSLNSSQKETQTVIQELEEKNRYQRELLTSLAHELKTPLGIISLYQSLNKEETNPIELTENNAIIDAELTRMNDIVEETLFLFKGEDPQHIETLETINLSDMINSLIKIHQPDFIRNGMTVSTTIAPNVYTVFNKSYSERIIRNYLSNASKYSLPNSAIVVKLTEQGRLLVSNPGEMNLATRKMIWQKFYKGESSRTTNGFQSSSGLGLSIVKAIGDKFNHAYGVESNNNKITFYYQFPVDQTE